MQSAIIRDKHDLDDTLQLSLTHKELAALVSGLICLDMIMPEFEDVTRGIMDKFEQLTTFQDFFSTRTPPGWEGPPMFGDLEDGEEPPEPDDTGGVE